MLAGCAMAFEKRVVEGESGARAIPWVKRKAPSLVSHGEVLTGKLRGRMRGAAGRTAKEDPPDG
jgi:hypothetical protein